MDKSNLLNLMSVQPKDATAIVKLLGSYSPKGLALRYYSL